MNNKERMLAQLCILLMLALAIAYMFAYSRGNIMAMVTCTCAFLTAIGVLASFFINASVAAAFTGCLSALYWHYKGSEINSVIQAFVYGTAVTLMWIRMAQKAAKKQSTEAAQ